MNYIISKHSSKVYNYHPENRDISRWDVKNLKYKIDIFINSPLENNLPTWYCN